MGSALARLASSDSTDHDEPPSRSSSHGSSGHYFRISLTSCGDDVENLGWFIPSPVHVDFLSSNHNSQQQGLALSGRSPAYQLEYTPNGQGDLCALAAQSVLIHYSAHLGQMDVYDGLLNSILSHRYS